MPQISGTINVKTSNRRKQHRLIDISTNLGEVRTSDDKLMSTKFALWVPQPTDITHQAGIFISLSNASGRAFVRLNPGDLESLTSFLNGNIDTMNSVFQQAYSITEQLHLLDLSIHKTHPLMNYTISELSASPSAEPAEPDVSP